MKDEIFEEYSREKEPTKYYKTYAWKTAIGLQKVDGLVITGPTGTNVNDVAVALLNP